jgi:hypothetical protein
VLRRSLFRADAPGDYFRSGVILSANWRARNPPQHRYLADMRQCIGNGRLEQHFGRSAERRTRREIFIECREGREKSCNVIIPFAGIRCIPRFLALRDGERPIEKIANVAKYLFGSARAFRNLESREFAWRATKCFAAPVGDGRKCVAQKFTGRIAGRSQRRCSSRGQQARELRYARSCQTASKTLSLR